MKPGTWNKWETNTKHQTSNILEYCQLLISQLLGLGVRCWGIAIKQRSTNGEAQRSLCPLTASVIRHRSSVILKQRSANGEAIKQRSTNGGAEPLSPNSIRHRSSVILKQRSANGEAIKQRSANGEA